MPQARPDNPPRADDRRSVGDVAELAVRDWMIARGWIVIAQNVRWREGELDLIAVDGGTLVFAEVKALRARHGRPPFGPLESIGYRKRERIRMLAARWLSDDLRRMRHESNVSFHRIRFDAFGVVLDEQLGITDFEHVESAF